MIVVGSDENDDPAFVRTVQSTVAFYLRNRVPNYIAIIKVDHWFDFKWRQFSHKIFGALGIWRETLRFPPFHPNRIVEEFHFEINGEGYERIERYLHVFQPSSENAQHKLRRNQAVYVWFSGGTKGGNQASLMIYDFPDKTQYSWYASFIRGSDHDDWRIRKTEGISKAELGMIISDV